MYVTSQDFPLSILLRDSMKFAELTETFTRNALSITKDEMSRSRGWKKRWEIAAMGAGGGMGRRGWIRVRDEIPIKWRGTWAPRGHRYSIEIAIMPRRGRP